ALRRPSGREVRRRWRVFRQRRRPMRKTATGSVARLTALALIVLLGWWAAPPAAAQTRQTKQVMRQKLAHSQQLLTALVTSDWASLGSHSRDLEALTNQPGWDVLRLPE